MTNKRNLRAGHIWYRATTIPAQCVMGLDGTMIVGPVIEGLYDIYWLSISAMMAITVGALQAMP